MFLWPLFYAAFYENSTIKLEFALPTMLSRLYIF